MWPWCNETLQVKARDSTCPDVTHAAIGQTRDVTPACLHVTTPLYFFTFPMGMSGLDCGGAPTCPVASCSELSLLAPLTSRHTATRRRIAPRTTSTPVNTALATGGTVEASFMRCVTSSGSPLMLCKKIFFRHKQSNGIRLRVSCFYLGTVTRIFIVNVFIMKSHQTHSPIIWWSWVNTSCTLLSFSTGSWRQEQNLLILKADSRWIWCSLQLTCCVFFFDKYLKT